MKNGFIVGFIALFVFLTFSKEIFAKEGDYATKVLGRGEVVSRVVEFFELKEKKRSSISECLSRSDECFFVFAAMSDFDGIGFSPLTLYPDVKPQSRYYDDINVASMLGLVHGYLGEYSTPFKPELVMTRIQSLKLVLGASELVQWLEQFELTEIEATTFGDVSGPGQWWYPRYLNFALKAGILEEGSTFRPDEAITVAELEAMMQSTARYLESGHDDSQ